MITALPAVINTIVRTHAVLPPPAKAKVLTMIAAASGMAMASIHTAIEWAKGNPIKTALIVESLVTNGANVMEFADFFTKDQASKEYFSSLQALSESVKKASDADNMGLSADIADTTRDVLRQQMGRTLVRAFGSLDAARKVQLALDTLTEADYNWLHAIGTGRA